MRVGCLVGVVKDGWGTEVGPVPQRLKRALRDHPALRPRTHGDCEIAVMPGHPLTPQAARRPDGRRCHLPACLATRRPGSDLVTRPAERVRCHDRPAPCAIARRPAERAPN